MLHPKGPGAASIDLEGVPAGELLHGELQPFPAEAPHLFAPGKIEQLLNVGGGPHGPKDGEWRRWLVQQHAAQDEPRESEGVVGMKVAEHHRARLIEGDARLRQMDGERGAGIEQDRSVDQDAGVVCMGGEGRTGPKEGDLH